MDNIIFTSDPKHFSNNSGFEIHISNVLDKQQLLTQLYSKLLFPSYFGFNWDALSDCLRDLSWIKEREVILIHDTVPGLTNDDLKTYLAIIADSIRDWENSEEHNLIAVFSSRDKNIIDQALQHVR